MNASTPTRRTDMNARMTPADGTISGMIVCHKCSGRGRTIYHNACLLCDGSGHLPPTTTDSRGHVWHRLDSGLYDARSRFVTETLTLHAIRLTR